MLADHVRACCVEQDVVLLDLRQGRYLSVAGADNTAVSSSVIDWPTESASTAAELPGGGTNPSLNSLLTRNLIVPASALWTYRIDHLPTPTSTIDIDDSAARPEVTFRSTLRFLVSVAVASVWMRAFTLDQISQRVVSGRRVAGVPLYPSKERQLLQPLTAFNRLRPFFFTARDRCLYDSLALVGFLTRHGLHAHWVIGVKTNPFRAHSWVQCGTTVLNDSHEHVRRFRPILVV